MQKKLRMLCVVLAVCVLLGLASGCKRVMPNISELIPAEPAEETRSPVEPAPAAEAGGLAVSLPGVYVNEEDPDNEFDVYEIGGVLLFEDVGWEDGALSYYFAQEYWPDDPSELYDGAVTSVMGGCQDFSNIDEANYYFNDYPLTVEITPTSRGFSFNYVEGTDYTYVRTDDASYHTSAEEQMQALRREHPGAVTDPTLAGSWTMSAEICSILLTLREDGSFQYAGKITGSPLKVIIGAWAVDRSEGVLYLRGEIIGCGQTTFSYTEDCRLRDGQMYLTDRDAALLPYFGEVPFSRAEEDWLFPAELNESIWSDYGGEDDYSEIGDYVTERLYESGSYTTEWDDTFYYSYDVPELLIDSPDAAAVNAEIEERFLSLAEEELAAIEEGVSAITTEIGWYADPWDGLLTVVVWAESDWGSTDYGVYCMDTETGKRLTNEQILERLDITEEAFLEATRAAAERYFVNMFSAIAEEDRESYGYNERLAWTVSDENINMELMLYPDYDGDLAVIAPIGSIAGADWYYHYLYPFLGAMG